MVVAIDVVDRDDDEHDAVEQGPQGAEGELAEEHLHRLFPLDLTGVDVGLDPDHRLPAPVRGCGVDHEGTGGEHVRDALPFGAPAELAHLEVGPAEAERVEEGGHVGVRRGLGPAGPLGAGLLGAEGHGNRHRQREDVHDSAEGAHRVPFVVLREVG